MTKTVDLAEALVLLGGDAGLLDRALRRGELTARADTLTVYPVQRSARSTFKDLPTEERAVVLPADFWVGVEAVGETQGEIDWTASEATYVKRWLEDCEFGQVEMEETVKARGVHLDRFGLEEYKAAIVSSLASHEGERPAASNANKTRAAAWLKKVAEDNPGKNLRRDDAMEKMAEFFQLGPHQAKAVWGDAAPDDWKRAGKRAPDRYIDASELSFAFVTRPGQG